MIYFSVKLRIRIVSGINDNPSKCIMKIYYIIHLKQSEKIEGGVSKQ